MPSDPPVEMNIKPLEGITFFDVAIGAALWVGRQLRHLQHEPRPTASEHWRAPGESIKAQNQARFLLKQVYTEEEPVAHQDNMIEPVSQQEFDQLDLPANPTVEEIREVFNAGWVSHEGYDSEGRYITPSES